MVTRDPRTDRDPLLGSDSRVVEKTCNRRIGTDVSWAMVMLWGGPSQLSCLLPSVCWLWP
jgi:hypothetical protein